MRRALAAAVLCLIACGGEPLPPERPRGASKVAKGARHGSEATREKADPEPLSGEGRAWGGWRYAGDPDDCFFVVGRRCFATEASACKAAKCGKGRCESSGAGPAQIRCR